MRRHNIGFMASAAAAILLGGSLAATPESVRVVVQPPHPAKKAKRPAKRPTRSVSRIKANVGRNHPDDGVHPQEHWTNKKARANG